jgi:2-methoxy-6-polyprenyl-1,4-benzoquinol methylase
MATTFSAALRATTAARALTTTTSSSSSSLARPVAAAALLPVSSRRHLSRTSSLRHNPQEKTTHFGYETVSEKEKEQRVAGVFTSVAETYDRMNDLMSFGWHRVWKDHFVSSLNPGMYSPGHPIRPQHILDVAGGTGDIAFRHLHHAHVVNANPSVRVTISDINASMLAVGESRARELLPPQQLDSLSFLEANAEKFPTLLDGRPAIPDNSVDLYTVAFGIRNFTNPSVALREALRVLKPGGLFACLEFSKVQPNLPLLDALYQRWSFSAIPLIGQVVAGDRDSYQYLVESIQRFPSQEEFRGMIEDAGFVVAGKGYENLTGGIAAVHRGIKPL